MVTDFARVRFTEWMFIDYTKRRGESDREKNFARSKFIWSLLVAGRELINHKRKLFTILDTLLGLRFTRRQVSLMKNDIQDAERSNENRLRLKETGNSPDLYSDTHMHSVPHRVWLSYQMKRARISLWWPTIASDYFFHLLNNTRKVYPERKLIAFLLSSQLFCN